MRILGRFVPTGTGWEAAYTEPAGRGHILHAVQVANREASNALKIGIAIAPLGAADANSQHYMEGFSVPNGDAGSDPSGTPIVLDIRLAPTDVVRVKSDGAATFTFLTV